MCVLDEDWCDQGTDCTKKGRKPAYLDGADPKEPNIKHAVGNEASEVQSNEVETESYNTDENRMIRVKSMSRKLNTDD